MKVDGFITVDIAGPEPHLESRIKYTKGDFGPLTRVKSPHETLRDITSICTRIGVTRTSDITFLDRLYIPNYSAVLPGTEDQIWVYSGKGIARLSAKAGALMESIERYSSLISTHVGPLPKGSYYDTIKSGQIAIHPSEVVESVRPGYDDENVVMEYVPAFDLLCNESVLVPAEIAFYGYEPELPITRVFSHFHTNGLASGNVLEEAICHALCEVIERDAVSIADLCTSSVPYSILNKIDKSIVSENMNKVNLRKVEMGNQFVDDPSIFPEVNISEIVSEYEPIKHLVNRFSEAKIPLMIKDLTQWDIGIPTFAASSIEWITYDYGYFAKGYGTHPDARTALIRAITEVSQTRAANIQGARDDLTKIRYKADDEIYKRKWQFMPALSSCTWKNQRPVKEFSEIDSFTTEDILEEIKLILSCLKEAGLRRAIIVDLTNPNVKIPVVRAIVPGLETFEMTKVVMGNRAKEHFNRFYSS